MLYLNFFYIHAILTLLNDGVCGIFSLFPSMLDMICFNLPVSWYIPYCLNFREDTSSLYWRAWWNHNPWNSHKKPNKTYVFITVPTMTDLKLNISHVIKASSSCALLFIFLTLFGSFCFIFIISYHCFIILSLVWICVKYSPKFFRVAYLNTTLGFRISDCLFPTDVTLIDTGDTTYTKAQQKYALDLAVLSRITKFVGPTWGPSGSCRPQMGPMLAPWTLLSGLFCYCKNKQVTTDKQIMGRVHITIY